MMARAGQVAVCLEGRTPVGVIQTITLNISNIPFLNIDLDIDSDNNGTLDNSAAEDQIEDTASTPGKLIPVNDGDADGDGTLNCSDYDGDEGNAPQFAPISLQFCSEINPAVAKVKFSYPEITPGTTSSSSGPEIRIWTKDGNVSRNRADLGKGGDFVGNGNTYSLADLPLDPNAPDTPTRRLLFLEGVTPSTAVADSCIEVLVDPDGPAATFDFDLTDTVPSTTVTTDLDADLNHDGVVEDSEDEEDSDPGLAIGRDRQVRVKLNCAPYNMAEGTVTLECRNASPGAAIKVWEWTADGTEVLLISDSLHENVRRRVWELSPDLTFADLNSKELFVKESALMTDEYGTIELEVTWSRLEDTEPVETDSDSILITIFQGILVPDAEVISPESLQSGITVSSYLLPFSVEKCDFRMDISKEGQGEWWPMVPWVLRVSDHVYDNFWDGRAPDGQFAGPGVYTFLGVWYRHGTSILLATASCKVIVSNADLDIIKPDGSELAEEDEETEGEVVQVNIDDDDNDGDQEEDNEPTPDKDDLDGVTGEDDLLRLKLHSFGSAGLSGFTYKLHFDNTNIAIWQEPNKTEAVTSDTTTFSTDADTTVYLEGKTPSSSMDGENVTLRLYQGTTLISEDTVKIIVAQMIFAIFDPDGAANSESTLRSYLSVQKKDSRTDPYVVEGTEACYAVFIWSTEKYAQIALAAQDGYVVFRGHSNFGIGFAFAKNLGTIGALTNLGQDLGSINWVYMREEQGHPDFWIEDSEYGDRTIGTVRFRMKE